jgi:hypothetical protein
MDDQDDRERSMNALVYYMLLPCLVACIMILLYVVLLMVTFEAGPSPVL